MIVFMTLVYVALLFVLIKLKVLPNTKATWLSTVVWMTVLFIFLFIPMQWGAPSGPVNVVTRAVQVVPNVGGQVVDIAVEPNTPLNKGDVLFQIDPEPFKIAVAQAKATKARVEAQVLQDKDALNSAMAQLSQAEARRDLAQLRFDDDTKLVENGTISQNRLERRQTDLDAAQGTVAQMMSAVSRAETEIGALTEDGVVAKLAEATAALELAEWNLDQTTVRAPSDGFVTNLALAEGQRVTSLPFAPSMVFVDTSERTVLAEVHQIYLRHLEPGQPAELTFKTLPGVVLPGKVETVLDVASQGQAIVSGTAAQPGRIRSEPFLVRIVLDDPDQLAAISPGTAGTTAIYTESVVPTHVIRKVMIRMTSILNYVRPAL
ncbi:multidrug resistance efflux pump [Aliiruegeria haliotis]|uniref:Multidrug resistance efflux pump n=1 Tax=Aliiruegeria haliotis TaxID=1280846 RepID=A0A2T0RF24_9RHOB|nr:efflux RND transporter periplasmic adaptor subunit [Aliiruegeria haliotis]PRY19773.1 multidrug resistance efflux pump [Aliiruegeria haliotis]